MRSDNSRNTTNEREESSSEENIDRIILGESREIINIS